MADVEWLAALLCPRDVALHPNFRGDERVTAPALLAVVLSAQTGRFAQERQRAGGEVEQLDSTGLEIVDAVFLANTVGNVGRGAEALARFSRNWDSTAPTLAVVCAVIASASFAEDDQFPRSLELLTEALGRDMECGEDLARLLRALLLNNLALRRREVGRSNYATVREARDLLESVDVTEIPPFSLSLGTSWASSRTLEKIRDLLIDAADLHLSDYDDTYETRLALVRREPAFLSLWRSSRTSTALDRLLEKSFDSLNSGRRGFRFGAPESAAEATLIEALLATEHSGHPAAIHQRSRLGMLRVLQSRESGEVWQMREGLRLLRQAKDRKRFSSLCNLVVEEGPLEALREEALHVLDEGGAKLETDEVDAVLINNSANLLGAATAARARARLVADRLWEPDRSATRWVAPSRSYEARMKAARRVSRSLSEEAQLLTLALADVIAEEARDLDDVVAGLIQSTNPDVLADEELPARMAAFLDSPETESFESTRRAIDMQLRPPVQERVDIVAPHELDLLTLATIVDDLREVPPHERTALLSGGLLDSASTLLTRSMRAVRDSAASGVFPGGKQVYEADLAVALASYTTESRLWGEIAELLCDPRVQRDDKVGAIRRIVGNIEEVDDAVRPLFEGRAEQLLVGGPTFMESALDPWPPAVGLIAVLDLVPSTRLMTLVGKLLGSDEPIARSEGTYILGRLSQLDSPAAWLTTSAFLMSYSEHVEVRAAAGHSLCHLLGQRGELDVDAVETRLLELLAEDGVAIPMRVLDGLKESRATILPGLQQTLEALAATHMNRVVRKSARGVLAGAGPA